MGQLWQLQMAVGFLALRFRTCRLSDSRCSREFAAKALAVALKFCKLRRFWQLWQSWLLVCGAWNFYRRAHCQLGGKDDQARQRTVFTTISAEFGQRLYSGFFSEHFVGRDIFYVEQVSRPEGLLRGNQQLLLAAKVVTQLGV